MSGQQIPDLPELQRLVWALITGPEGVGPEAAALGGAGRSVDDDLDFLVVGDARLDAVGRLDVYADMYFYRLRDCLAEDYPKLLAWLGDARFHNLVTDFLLAHPSSHFSLRELGRPLPGFVARHELAASHRGLADLAALEWARCDVFDEADAEPLGRAALLAAAPEPDRLRLRRLPATRMLELDPVALLRWRELDSAAEDDSAPDPGGAETRRARTPVLVWRRGTCVHHRSLAEDEAACLRALGDRVSLAALGELVVARQPAGASDEDLAARFAGLLESWAANAILTSD